MPVKLKALKKEEFENLKHLIGNRPENKSKYNKFRRELEQDLSVLSRREWIIVINNQDEIIDGQNRLRAVLEYNKKHKKTPITVVQCTLEHVTGDAAIARAQELNSAKEKWKESDHLESWIERGLMEYAELKRYLHMPCAKGLSSNDIYLICGDFDNKHAKKDMQNGTFHIQREEEDIVKLMKQLGQVKKILLGSYGPSTIVIPMFLRCTQIRNIDVTRLINKLNRPTQLIHYSNRPDEILKHFDKMYNYRETDTLDLVQGYNVVQSYNTIQKENAKVSPRLKITEEQEARQRGREAARKKINDTEKHTTRIPPVIIDEEHGEDGIAPV